MFYVMLLVTLPPFLK